MKPWVRLDEERTPGGAVLSLWQRGEELSIRLGAQTLMSSRCQASEIALADLALAELGERARARVLVGGLGFGYTARAALDRLRADATVVVAELSGAVVRWNRGPLADLAGRPLEDARVRVEEGDVVALLRQPKQSFDAVLLDVDNGPRALTEEGNGWLYEQPGLLRIARSLRPGGVLAVWSAATDDAFTGQLRASGYEVTRHRVRASKSGKGERHVVWVGKLAARRTHARRDGRLPSG